MRAHTNDVPVGGVDWMERECVEESLVFLLRPKVDLAHQLHLGLGVEGKGPEAVAQPGEELAKFHHVQ
jgi:hypothetical protein